MPPVPPPPPPPPHMLESSKPAICWAGIWSGVFVTLSLTAVLTILGAGLGFAVKSGWTSATGAKTLGVMTIIWLIIVQWIASATGGYITGRLRTRWVNVHTHEVFFRDTAHGFVTWAVANVLMMMLVMSAGAFVGHHGARMAEPVIYNITENFGTQDASANADNANSSATAMPDPGRGMSRGGMGNPLAYYSDALFRTSATAAPAPDQDVRAEANRILMKSLKDGTLSDEDKNYLAQLVTTKTGLPDADAKNRVDDVLSRLNADESQMREMADNARKSAAVLSLCIALSMLVGAFVASVAATLGGHIRDDHI